MPGFSADCPGDRGQQSLLRVSKPDLSVNQAVRREVDATCAVSLSDAAAHQCNADEIHVNKVSGSILALDTGVLSGPQDLRAVMNGAMNQAIDEALDKPSSRAALTTARRTEP